MVHIVHKIFTAKETKVSYKVLFREQSHVVGRLKVKHEMVTDVFIISTIGARTRQKFFDFLVLGRDYPGLRYVGHKTMPIFLDPTPGLSGVLSHRHELLQKNQLNGQCHFKI
jgi:hypothetical protein